VLTVPVSKLSLLPLTSHSAAWGSTSAPIPLAPSSSHPSPLAVLSLTAEGLAPLYRVTFYQAMPLDSFRARCEPRKVDNHSVCETLQGYLAHEKTQPAGP